MCNQTDTVLLKETEVQSYIRKVSWLISLLLSDNIDIVSISTVHPVSKRCLVLTRFDTDGQRETLKVK
jgi:hypothetical protein